MKLSTSPYSYETGSYAQIPTNLDQSERNMEAIQKNTFCPVERNLEGFK
jgi:hypothetical protein